MADIAIFTDFDDAEKMLSKLQKKVEQVEGGARTFGAVLSGSVFSDVIDHFGKEQGSAGRWHAWSDIYAEHMSRIGKGGNKLLQDTGRLRQAFTPASYRSVSEGILWYNPAKTRDGFPYAAAHDTGDGKMPKRDFMWLSDQALGKIEGITLDFILEDR